jgi:protein tyrosine/serine phosphatase
MRKILKLTGISLTFAGLALGSYLLGIQVSGNFAAVVPGEAYRSNQPSATDIAGYAARYGIRTIVNLRGSNENAAWYKDEVAAARRLGLGHVDFKMSADRQLDRDEAQQLAVVLRDAPKPVLIHCRSGSDRTGLASALYLNRIAKMDEHTAERQLSIRYGHIGIPFFSPTYAMDESWEHIEKDKTIGS